MLHGREVLSDSLTAHFVGVHINTWWTVHWVSGAWNIAQCVRSYTGRELPCGRGGEVSTA
jgi:hypothetical protein